MLTRFSAQFCSLIDKTNETLGKTVAWLILAITGIFCYEIILRSFLNQPTLWAHEGSQYLFAAYFVLGGAYALKEGFWVNVDILVNKLSPRHRVILNCLASLAAIVFAAALIKAGYPLALQSIRIREASQSYWGPPIYPLKILLVLGALLIGLQALAKLIRDFVLAVSRGELK